MVNDGRVVDGPLRYFEIDGCRVPAQALSTARSSPLITQRVLVEKSLRLGKFFRIREIVPSIRSSRQALLENR